MPSYHIKTNRPSISWSLFYKSKHPHIFAHLLQLHCEVHNSAGIKIEQVTELLWDKYFRWCEWKQEERYKGYNRSPHEIKSQVLYSLHTQRSDESWFNGLSYQQGSITPQWFSSTWKAEHHYEWQEMRSSNHAHNPFLPIPLLDGNSKSQCYYPALQEKEALYLIGVSAYISHTITGYAVTVIKVRFQHSTHHDLFQCKHSLSQLNQRPLHWGVNGHFYVGEKEKWMQLMACTKITHNVTSSSGKRGLMGFFPPSLRVGVSSNFGNKHLKRQNTLDRHHHNL